jgi:hypothetical protein
VRFRHLQTKHAGCHFIPEAMIFWTALQCRRSDYWSKGKMRFQSFFMLITIQTFLLL